MLTIQEIFATLDGKRRYKIIDNNRILTLDDIMKYNYENKDCTIIRNSKTIEFKISKIVITDLKISINNYLQGQTVLKILGNRMIIGTNHYYPISEIIPLQDIIEPIDNFEEEL